MREIATLIISLLAVGAVALAAPAGTDRHPDADTVLLDSVNNVAYQPDGTSVSHSVDTLQILTEAGRRASRLQQFHFNTNYSTVTVARAEIIKPEGQVVTIDVQRASSVMTESGQMDANIYDPANKILQLSLADLQVGDTLRLETERVSHKARIPGVWADYNLFEYTMPIERLSYTVVSPPELPLRHTRLRGAISNSVSYTTAEQGGGVAHRWEVRDAPQLFTEPNMPPLHTVAQRLIVSTAEDWPSISRWYWELSQPRLAAANPAVTNEVERLIADISAPELKMRRIFTWVSQNIRYMGITLEDEAPGYEPHDVAITFDNRYGVCRDKAALLVEMLRIAGLEAYPVLIHAGAKLDPDVPMTFFNHAIVAAKLPGADDYTLMDPTNESTADLLPAYLGNRSYLVAHPQGETLRVSPVAPATQNLVRVVSEGILDETERLTLNTSVAFDGINDTIYRGHFLRQSREQRRRFFESLAKARLPGAELTSFELLPRDLQDTDQPLTARFSVRAADFPVRGSAHYVLEMPWLSPALGFAHRLLGQTGLEERRFPLETDLACGTSETIKVEYGDNLGEPVSLPEDIRRHEAGILYRRQTGVTNGTIYSAMDFRLESPSYPPQDYQLLRRMRGDIEYAARQSTHFAPNPLSTAPDRVILADHTAIELTSASSWTTTHYQAQRILTYAGAKRFSEIKLRFNPAWQTAEVVSAVVSNSNGTVHHIKPSEINLMDASWNGAAPRYPGARILVAALPGVATGSVITTTIRRTQEQAPFFDFHTSFGGPDPINHKSVELLAPSDLALMIEAPHSGIASSWEPVAGGRVLRRWEVHDQPAARREDHLPPPRLYLPALRVSGGNWGDYAVRVALAADEALAHAPVAVAAARELVAGTHHPRQRVEAVRNYVMTHIRPAGPAFTRLPLGFTPPDQTLADGYGHAADRALLLVAMLRAIGEKCQPILVDSISAQSPLTAGTLAIPRVGQFDTLLVELEPRKPNLLQLLFARTDPGTPIYLNDGDQYTPLGVTPSYSHPALSRGGELIAIEAPPDLRTRSESEWTIELSVDGSALITVTNSVYGALVSPFRKLYHEMPPEKRSRHYQEMVAAISQEAEALTPLSTDLEGYPGVTAFQARAARYAVAGDGILTLKLPVAEPLAALRADRRSHPLWLPTDPSAIRESYRVIFPPEAGEILLSPESCDWPDLPGGMGASTVESHVGRTADGRLLLVVERRRERRSALVEPEHYSLLLEYNRRLTHPASRTVVVELPARP